MADATSHHPPIEQRLRAKCQREPGEDGCWIWTGSVNGTGYGRIYYNGRSRMAHRVAYELAHGEPLAPGLEIDHLCRVRRCIRPDHLEPVTRRENVLRSYEARLGRPRPAPREPNTRESEPRVPKPRPPEPPPSDTEPRIIRIGGRHVLKFNDTIIPLE